MCVLVDQKLQFRMSQANRMGLNMTTASGTNLSRWFTKKYLASRSDFDYAEEMKAESKPDEVRIFLKLNWHFIHTCFDLALSTPGGLG